MQGGEEYNVLPLGILTFRGNAFRQNAAAGDVGRYTDMSLAWSADTGSLAGSNVTFYGVGYPGQPAIMKWSKEVRAASNISDEKKAVKSLKEVIMAAQDGKVYFLDLKDGKPTREALNVGYPMRGTPSIHPEGIPMMSVGQYARKLKRSTGDIGLRFYNLYNQSFMYLLDGLDGRAKRPLNEVGSFQTSALIARTEDNNETLVTAGTNGMLYTMKLGTQFDYKQGTLKMDPATVSLRTQTDKKGKFNAVEASVAAYGSYVFYADLKGVLRCVDTTTMTTVWAVSLGDAVYATPALDFDASGTLWVYVSNVLENRAKGDVSIRRFNAMTGEEGWSVQVAVKKNNESKATAGAMASPVIGSGEASDLVYFTLSHLSPTQTFTLLGSDGAAAAGAVIAVSKSTGEVKWAYPLDAHTYSSPVLVKDQSGETRIIQATNSGMLYSLSALTGEIKGTLKLDGRIEGSPAVYGDMLVIGTTGKNGTHIYGVKLGDTSAE